MTESSNRVIIEGIEPRSWALRVRDTKTDQVHELELRGGGPWKIEFNGKAEVADGGGKTRTQVAAPPDDAITLRLERSGDPDAVRVGAVGRGAKAWADAQGTLLGSRWFHDAMGAPVVLLEDRPSLVEEIRVALPAVRIDLSKYTAEPSSQPDAPGVIVPAANTAPPASLKKSRRGFGGKVKVPPDTDIELRLSNIERADDRVSIVATGRREEVDAAEVLEWVQQRAKSLGPWGPDGTGQLALVRDSATFPEKLLGQFPDIHLDLRMYKRPGVELPDRGSPVAPENMVFSEISRAIEREDPRMVRILHESIRLLSENFIVIPRTAGYGFRSVQLRSDRSAGVFDGLPIGTLLLQVTLHHNADPTILTKDWEPLKETLRALNRPARQFEMLREYVSNAVNSASSAARVLVAEPAQIPEAREPASTPQGDATQPADAVPARTPTAAPRQTAKSRGRKKARPEPGPGPGGLSWEPLEDGGVEGLAARWGEGQFKLLQIGGDRYGLFYEHDGGGYETLLCGSLDDGKTAAGERISSSRPALDLEAAQVACATTRRTGPPTHDEITLHLRRMEGQRPDLIIRATGDRVHEWIFNNNSILGHVWERGEDDFPVASIFDSPAIVANLRKDFPGVNIDTSAYKKPKTESVTATQPAPETPAVTPTPAPDVRPTPEPPVPDATPAADDQAGQDAELMRSFTSELDSMLDEED